MEQHNQREQHIRPSIRRSNKTVVPNTSIEPNRSTQQLQRKQQEQAAANGGNIIDIDDDKVLEKTRQRIQSSLVLNSNNQDNNEEQQRQMTPVMMDKTERPLVGILKKPSKYASSKTRRSLSTVNKTDDDSVAIGEDTLGGRTSTATTILKDVVKEREPIIRQQTSLLSSSCQYCEELPPQPFAVEGHAVQTTTTTTNNSASTAKTNNPMVISSISDLLEQARRGSSSTTTTSPTPTPDVIKVEADLSFACMTPEEYDETVKEEAAAESSTAVDCTNPLNGAHNGDDVVCGHNKVFLDDDDDNVSDDNVNEEDENDDPMLFGVMTNSDDELTTPSPAPPRAFIQLWDVLTDWTTPETIVLIKQWRAAAAADHDTLSDTPTSPPQQVDQSDVGSSRRKGLQAMLTMHLASTMEHLGFPQEDRRRVEVRLFHLLQTMNFSRPMAKLNSTMWKAMTCLMVEMVMMDSSSALDKTGTALPCPVQDVDMKREEYEYLIRSAILNLETQT